MIERTRLVLYCDSQLSGARAQIAKFQEELTLRGVAAFERIEPVILAAATISEYEPILILLAGDTHLSQIAEHLRQRILRYPEPTASEASLLLQRQRHRLAIQLYKVVLDL